MRDSACMVHATRRWIGVDVTQPAWSVSKCACVAKPVFRLVLRHSVVPQGSAGGLGDGGGGAQAGWQPWTGRVVAKPECSASRREPAGLL